MGKFHKRDFQLKKRYKRIYVKLKDYTKVNNLSLRDTNKSETKCKGITNAKFKIISKGEFRRGHQGETHRGVQQCW